MKDARKFLDIAESEIATADCGNGELDAAVQRHLRKLAPFVLAGQLSSRHVRCVLISAAYRSAMRSVNDWDTLQ